MKFLTFDTETTGLPRDRYGKIDDSSNWPYVVQLSWILYDNETNRLFKSNDIIRVNDDVDISPESINVHGITRKRCNQDGIPIKTALSKFQKAMKEQTYSLHTISILTKNLLVSVQETNAT